MININKNYFSDKDFIKHTDNVFEAQDFVTYEQRRKVIRFIDSQDTGCLIHKHESHTLSNQKKSDILFFLPECFLNGDSVELESEIYTIGKILHYLKDAAARYTNKPMSLSKIVMHKYVDQGHSEPHLDSFPIATILYLNDNYLGGELYFPAENFEIKPREGSLIVFDGSQETGRHGVRMVSGQSRYALVAFWDYLSENEQKQFEVKQKDNSQTKQNKKFETVVSKYGNNAEILYEDIFPILVVKNFIGNDILNSLITFLDINDTDSGDECWSPICFREYWNKLNPGNNDQPELTDSFSTNPLPEINEKIKKHVEFFIKQDAVFSKFKGHKQPQYSSAPPHIHPAAIAVGIVSLNDDYLGGELFIPYYDIQFKLKAGNLYIFLENEFSQHGVTRIEKNTRMSLVSHWQSPQTNYDWAGVAH